MGDELHFQIVAIDNNEINGNQISNEMRKNWISSLNWKTDDAGERVSYFPVKLENWKTGSN